MDREVDVAPLVAPLVNVRRCSPADTLGSVLTPTQSSHEPIFVFDTNGTFRGLVSLYQVLYHSRLPRTTKIHSCLFHPPHLTRTDPIYEVAAAMLSTRLYSLPVMNPNRTIAGVIHSEDILVKLASSAQLLQRVARTLSIHRPVTASIQATIKDIYHLLRQKGVSRIVLVGKKGELAGIVARSDLSRALISPTPRQRFTSNNGNPEDYLFDGEDFYRQDYPVRRYATTEVFTLPARTATGDIIKAMASSETSSVVLVGRDNRPTGFLSNRDLLQAVAGLRPETRIPITIQRPPSRRKGIQSRKIYALLERYGRKLHQREPVEHLELFIKEAKSAEGEPISFSATLKAILTSGEEYRASADSRILESAVRETIKRVDKQHRRHDRR